MLLLASACHTDMPDEQRLAIMREVARREGDTRWTSRLLGGWWRRSPKTVATQNEAMDMLTEYEGAADLDLDRRRRYRPGPAEGFVEVDRSGGWLSSSTWAMIIATVVISAVVLAIAIRLGVRSRR